jgi:hypothetical protein
MPDDARRQAGFGRNKQLLAEVERDLSVADGAGTDAPDAADVIDEARSERPGTAAAKSAPVPRRRG